MTVPLPFSAKFTAAAVVITGHGNKAFVSGSDIDMLAACRTADDGYRIARAFQAMTVQLDGDAKTSFDVAGPKDGAAQAMAAGASRTLPAGPEAVEALAASDGGRVLRARMTKTGILEHGVDVVFDCVASPATLDLGMHLLRATGMLVVVGTAGKQDVDWSLVWNRQLTVQGTINFGPEPSLGGRHTMAQVVEWLGDADYPVDGIVTHTFDLPEWKRALETASAGPNASAVKTTLRPNTDIPLVD